MNKAKNFKGTGTFLALLLMISLIFILTADIKAAYVSNSFKSRYVFNTEEDTTYKFPLIYEVNYEKKIKTDNIFGELNITPQFKYDLESEKEDIELKEAFLDLYLSDFDLRLGKQKVTWGKSDGLIVTNIVNSRDYTVHPVLEFIDQMQAVNAVKTNFYPEKGNLELVWIPEFKPAAIDKSLLAKKIPAGFKKDPSQKEIETEPGNSELFMRYSVLGDNFDYELMAGYSWSDTPTLHKNFKKKTVIPQHHRLVTVGGSFSTMEGPFVFRGEGAYISGKYFNLESPLSHLSKYPDGIIERDEIKWLAGIDYNYEGYLFSTQFMQEAVMDYKEGIIQNEYNNKLTFLVQKDFWRQTLNTEINFHYDLNEEILMAKPSLSYNYADSINIKAGANLNLERKKKKKDVVYLQTEYIF